MNNKKILLVEDNGIVAETLIENFPHYSVENPYSVVSAMDCWEECGDFDCIIVDMQISPEGLSTEENGIYTPLFGMAFINKIFKESTPEKRQELKKKILIYSAFTKDLKYRSQNNSGDSIWNTQDITVYEKNVTSIIDIIRHVNKLLK